MVETCVQEDVYEMSYCYNAESRNQDVFDRSVAPMVAHLLVVQRKHHRPGISPLAKTTLLEGLAGQGTEGSEAGDG
jgi:hypothetical protein